MVRELAVDNRETCFRYMRMTPDRKEYLLSLVAPLITKLSTNDREPIPPEQRFSLTLRHLATGECQISLGLQYRIGRETISKIIPAKLFTLHAKLFTMHLLLSMLTRDCHTKISLRFHCSLKIDGICLTL